MSEQVNKKDERTGDYIPASLVNESVLSESIHRRGTRVRSVVSARWEGFRKPFAWSVVVGFGNIAVIVVAG